MPVERKEFVFFGLLMFLSLGAFTFANVYTPFKSEVNVQKLEIDSVTNLQYGNWQNEPYLTHLFNGGKLYTKNDALHHSDFYDGSLTLVSTSDYWHIPLNENKAILAIEKDKKNTSLHLQLPNKNKLPVVSLVIQPDDFFSYENGIYVNGRDRDFTQSAGLFSMPWQQPANYYRNEKDRKEVFWSYYDTSGQMIYKSYSSIEVSGKATRCFPQKSLRLTAEKKYGSKKFKCDFFGDRNQYRSLVLRNGGNDNTKSLFRDMLMQSIAAPTGLLVSGFLPCEVYLNGEYWGIHFLQNRADIDFIAAKWKVKEKKITLVENWKLENGSEKEFNKLIRILNDKNLSFKKIDEIIDLNDLANYLSAQIFFANTDWPHNNLKMYFCNNGNESKWRFALFDTDYGFGYLGEESVNFDMFASLASRKDHFGKLYNALMKNDDFKKIFQNKMESFIKNQANKENMTTAIDKMENLLQPAMTDHTLRWRKPASVEEWQAEVEKLRFFAINRSSVVSKQLKTYFNNGN